MKKAPRDHGIEASRGKKKALGLGDEAWGMRKRDPDRVGTRHPLNGKIAQ